jgi:hypothetical protein
MNYTYKSWNQFKTCLVLASTPLGGRGLFCVNTNLALALYFPAGNLLKEQGGLGYQAIE